MEDLIKGGQSCGELVFYGLVDGGEVWLVTGLRGEGAQLGGEIRD